MLVVFFVKQKTAYDRRISDWSSDVCSSDLSARPTPTDSMLTAIEFCAPARICETTSRPSASVPSQSSEEGAGRRRRILMAVGDRKGVVWGKSVSVSVDIGGRRRFKKITLTNTKPPTTPLYLSHTTIK